METNLLNDIYEMLILKKYDDYNVADKLSGIYNILDLIQDKVDTETYKKVSYELGKGNETAFIQGLAIGSALAKELNNKLKQE